MFYILPSVMHIFVGVLYPLSDLDLFIIRSVIPIISPSAFVVVVCLLFLLFCCCCCLFVCCFVFSSFFRGGGMWALFVCLLFSIVVF